MSMQECQKNYKQNCISLKLKINKQKLSGKQIHTPNNDDPENILQEKNLERKKVYNFTQHASSIRLNEFLQKQWKKLISDLKNPRHTKFMPQKWTKILSLLENIPESRLNEFLPKQWKNIFSALQIVNSHLRFINHSKFYFR